MQSEVCGRLQRIEVERLLSVFEVLIQFTISHSYLLLPSSQRQVDRIHNLGNHQSLTYVPFRRGETLEFEIVYLPLNNNLESSVVLFTHPMQLMTGSLQIHAQKSFWIPDLHAGVEGFQPPLD